MITVIADDLTGAAEIAGICLRYGIDVSFGIDTIPEKKATVNIIATDTRSMTEDAAYETHFHLAEDIVSDTKNIIFKKCDSVLRGHVLIELLALVDATGKDRILLQPSNPMANRCIKNASYLIDDIPIEKTGFGNDPDFPSNTSLVKNLIVDRVAKEHHVEINTGVFNNINSKGIFIPDCGSVEELSENLSLYYKDVLVGGSAAFFEQFLIKMKLAKSKIKPMSLRFSSHYLLISGSAHPKSIQFSNHLEETNCPQIVFPETLLKNKLNKTILNNFIIELLDVYKDKKKVVLRASKTIIKLENSTLNLKTRMSLIAKQLIETSNINEVFIEGGATAYDVLDELHWKSFTPIAELNPGVVRMQYDKNPEKHITIKPGSYEWPKGLLN